MANILGLAEFKRYLRIEHSDEDSALVETLEEIEGLLALILKRNVVSEELVEKLTAEGNRTKLFLSHYPVDEEADFEVYDSVNEVVVSSYDYKIDYILGILTHGSEWGTGTNKYEVTYTGGMDIEYNYLTRILPSLKRAVKLWASDTYYHRDPRVLSEKAGDSSVNLEGIAVPRQVAAILALFRRPKF